MTTIRPLQPGDVAGAVRLVAEEEAALRPLVAGDLDRHFGDSPLPGSWFRAAWRDRQLAGLIGLHDDLDPNVSGVSWAVWVYVDRRFRGRGVGRSLVGEAVAEACRRSCRKLYLDVGNEERHERALAMYEKLGFVREGALRDYFREGEHKLIYALRLAGG